MVIIHRELLHDVCMIVVALTRGGRRHLSSLWEESTSWLLGWEGGKSHNRPVHLFQQCIAQAAQRRPAVWRQASPLNSPTTGGRLSFCVFRANLKATLPVFGTGGTSSFREPPLCFQGRDWPEWKWDFGFLFSSLISAAPRENYTL